MFLLNPSNISVNKNIPLTTFLHFEDFLFLGSPKPPENIESSTFLDSFRRKMRKREHQGAPDLFFRREDRWKGENCIADTPFASQRQQNGLRLEKKKKKLKQVADQNKRRMSLRSWGHQHFYKQLLSLLAKKKFTVKSHLGERLTLNPQATYQACVDSPNENRWKKKTKQKEQPCWAKKGHWPCNLCDSRRMFVCMSAPESCDRLFRADEGGGIQLWRLGSPVNSSDKSIFDILSMKAWAT